MLTAVGGVSGDILYSTQTSSKRGVVVDTYQDWNWPAEPTPGQQARWREIYAERFSRGPLQRVEDTAAGYISRGPGPYSPPRKVPGQVTMVCYAGNPFGGCGFGGVDVLPGTWSQFPLPPDSSDLSSGVSAGGLFSPAVLAQEVAQGQWRVEQRTMLDGRQVLVLSETAAGHIFLLPFLLWVDAQTYLPLKYVSGGSSALTSGIFDYLPPTPANLALFKVPIPRGYPRSIAGSA
jgi:hypothetical protein